NAANTTAASTRFFPRVVSSRNANMNSAASDARLSDEVHVGGVFKRRSRAVSRPCFLRSSAVGGRPVRPRVWIVPAAVPRCLVRRFRLVWAMGIWSLVVLVPGHGRSLSGRWKDFLYHPPV